VGADLGRWELAWRRLAVVADLHQRRHTSDHTFERIRQAILEVCGGRCKKDLGQFGGYLVFDALIGNTDRHHENWALLKREAGPTDHRLAPSFDHASSLGREMRDERRLRLIRENKIPEYLRKGWGAIYLEELGETEISPIELVSRLAARMPESFGPWLKRVEGVTDQAIMYLRPRANHAGLDGAIRTPRGADLQLDDST